MDRLYSLFTPKSFKIFTILTVALGDIFLFFYAKMRVYDFKFLSQELDKSFAMLKSMGQEVPYMDDQFKLQMLQLTANFVMLGMGLYLLYHFVMLIFFYLEKRVMIAYFKIVACMAPFFGILIFIDQMNYHRSSILFLIFSILYAIVAIGLVKYFLRPEPA